jgi:Tfp pilus assembly protein PilV
MTPARLAIDDGGFSLVEAMVALLLLSFVAMALTDSLLLAQALQRESGRWMTAVALAEEGLERGRVAAGGGADERGGFERRWSSSVAPDGLLLVESAVRWQGREVSLRTLAVASE